MAERQGRDWTPVATVGQLVDNIGQGVDILDREIWGNIGKYWPGEIQIDRLSLGFSGCVTLQRTER